MTSKLKIHKKLQRIGVFELDSNEMVEVKTEAPKKRAQLKKYYPMTISHNSLEEEDYLDLAPQLQGLEPSKYKMTIITSDDYQEWDQDDDEI